MVLNQKVGCENLYKERFNNEMSFQKIADMEKRIIEIKKKLDENLRNRSYSEENILLMNERDTLQREVSLLKGEETAIPIKTSYPLDVGAPCPHVISNGYKTYLIYYIGTGNSNWNETEVDVKIIDSKSDDFVALVSFNWCYSFRFGGINDEVLNGHPLYEHGLEAYEMHLIENSSWIKDQQKINSVHTNFSQKRWNQRKHYIFTFHDDIFECIANDYKIQVFKGSLKDIALLANKMLFDD